MGLVYHHGQIALQTEANTIPVAEMLADWVGPVGEFCRTADLIVLATRDGAGRLAFMAFSGPAPIVEIAGPSSVLLPLDGTTAAPDIGSAAACGGIAVGLAYSRRARLNGTLSHSPDGLVMEASEAFTNCRKYLAPSEAFVEDRRFGPGSRKSVALGDPWLASVLAGAETSFLASVGPDGIIDVSHRGGPPGFLRLDPEAGVLEWDEFVGDGMFKSAGNIRATGTMSLVVPELATGDAVELSGHAEVQVQRLAKRPRGDALLQNKQEFPKQGSINCRVDVAYRLTGFMVPRQRLEKRLRVTSASALDQQYPQ